MLLSESIPRLLTHLIRFAVLCRQLHDNKPVLNSLESIHLYTVYTKVNNCVNFFTFLQKQDFTFGIAPTVTKGLGPKPPAFSPAERFFRQRPGVTEVTKVTRVPDHLMGAQFL
ncbi:MAG: hypothetical protein H6Q71_2578 [Firmicutes bacterium]|nr:hypothetical protein [Bacillota bacterium]